MNNWSEKLLEAVAQAFQPVRITGAGETPALPIFHDLRVIKGFRVTASFFKLTAES
jgi:hypothetical protein